MYVICCTCPLHAIHVYHLGYIPQGMAPPSTEPVVKKLCLYEYDSCLPHTHRMAGLPSTGPVIQVTLNFLHSY